MNVRSPNDDGPKRFMRNWLTFDESRPVRPKLLRNFVLVVAACFAAAALMAIVN